MAGSRDRESRLYYICVCIERAEKETASPLPFPNSALRHTLHTETLYIHIHTQSSTHLHLIPDAQGRERPIGLRLLHFLDLLGLKAFHRKPPPLHIRLPLDEVAGGGPGGSQGRLNARNRAASPPVLYIHMRVGKMICENVVSQFVKIFCGPVGNMLFQGVLIECR